MSDRKAVIKNADMSEEMQQDSVECATQALEKYNIEKDIAAHIKKVSSASGLRGHEEPGRVNAAGQGADLSLGLMCLDRTLAPLSLLSSAGLLTSSLFFSPSHHISDKLFALMQNRWFVTYCLSALLWLLLGARLSCKFKLQDRDEQNANVHGLTKKSLHLGAVGHYNT
ncbi:uncharacterized protein LOC118174743 isoform X1 [Oxyura jamaicensis]|uniref:uncharacterized protein LOC118174743 isoform X1 n=1 Tax=Oxyura jamaicensis TaxID=8884 RepID=UPI0015A558FD|nr:uncharacterized protein LOC118174743 isoform X1 [Oxyura jamaicensis]